MANENTNIKEQVRIRKKALANGNVSLYLDIYQNKKRRYEFLKLYLVPEKTRADKDRNKQTLQLARSIQAKRIVELQNGTFGFLDAFKLETNFIDYYKAMMEKRKDSNGNYGNWKSALKYLERYAKPYTTFKDVGAKFLEGFKTYLQKEAKTSANKQLSQNSIHSYFCKVKACINQAFEERIIPYNVGHSVEAPAAGDPKRNYLTVEEVRSLWNTECRYPVLKRAFIFSCLTGLRWSDIHKMTWGEVQTHKKGTRIIFTQQKTRSQEYLDINSQAASLLGERDHAPADARVFTGLKYSAWYNLELQKWCMAAGISRTITFHCARHTFATVMLDQGVELYTVSKLLGHKEIRTTQIYAKVMDKKKQEAVEMMPNIILDKD